MSNPLGSNNHPSSDQPEEQKPTEKTEKPASDLSISDLMSLKSQLGGSGGRSGSASGAIDHFGPLPHEKNYQDADKQGKFDGKRTTDITRLLSDRAIARDFTTTPHDYSSSPNLQGKDFSGSQGPQGKDFTWSTTHMLNADANIGLTIPLGLRQHFQLRGIDVKGIEDKKLEEEHKKLLDELAKGNPLNDEALIIEEKRKVLIDAREALRRSLQIPDIVSNSLHLARILLELSYIEDARKAVGLAASVDPKNQLANQMFEEIERVHPHDIAFVPISSTANQLNKSNLAKRIINLSRGRIIVVGDLLIDELLEGKPTRISREAPVLILEHVDTELIPGGAANTAHNIAAMGAVCHAIGVCGDDYYSSKLATMLEKHNISHDLVRDSSRPTTVKTRILSKSHSLMQQLLRLDRISHERINEDTARRLAAKVAEAASASGQAAYNAIILSDYKAGTMVDTVIDACRRVSADQKIMLIVDAQNDFQRFSGCALITPNQPDSEQAVGYKIDSQTALERAGNDLLAISKADAVLLTRGGDGMALFRKHDAMVTLPPFNKEEVFDVTGAGDTVVATMALSLVTGATPVEAMALGNLAAGIVVKKPGTAVTSQKEMLDALEGINF